MCDDCATLLSQGLDLCVRARKLDAQERSNSAVRVSLDGKAWEASGLFGQFVESNNEHHPWREMAPRSATIPIWLQEQYDKDLVEWEQRSRHHLMQGCASRVK